ncbi:hypothetical protein MD484_g6086, partial [Candolleomyces efflorescens]
MSKITWTHNASDPAIFRIDLQRASDDRALVQIWESVDTWAGNLSVSWPYANVTESMYRLLAVNQSFPDQVYAQSPTFRFLKPTSSSPNTNDTTTSMTRPWVTPLVSTRDSPATMITMPAFGITTSTPEQNAHTTKNAQNTPAATLDQNSTTVTTTISGETSDVSGNNDPENAADAVLEKGSLAMLMSILGGLALGFILVV